MLSRVRSSIAQTRLRVLRLFNFTFINSVLYRKIGVRMDGNESDKMSEISEEEIVMDSALMTLVSAAAAVTADETKEEQEARPRPPAEKRSKVNTSKEDEGGYTTVEKRKKRVHHNPPGMSTTEDETSPDGSTYDVYLTSKQVLPKQMGLAKFLRTHNIVNIQKIQFKSLYKVKLSFENKQNAEKLIQCEKLKELDYRCQSADEVSLSYGVIRGADLDLSEQEMLEEFKCDTEIVSLKRLKRLMEGQWVDSTCIRIGFKSSFLPPCILGYGTRFEIEQYTFPVTQCSGCWKFGHLLRACPTKKAKCPKCGGGHPNCETTNYKCLNCNGPHMSLDKECPMFLKETEIRSIMARENCTYKKALDVFVKNQSENMRHHEPTCTLPTFIDTQRSTRDSENNNKSYRDAVLGDVTAHDSNVVFLSEASHTDTENSQPQLSGAAYKIRKLRVRKKARGGYQLDKDQSPTKERPTKKAGSSNTEKNKSDRLTLIQRLWYRLKEIIKANRSFEEKIYDVISIMIEEGSKWIMEFFKKGDLFTSVLGYINNIHNG